jgi:4-amino-4-deoxy-L-arabinose transferase-like glycosyltransferase
MMSTTVESEDFVHSSSARAWKRRLAFWRSPHDQPRWARPALLSVAGVSAFLYAWSVGNDLEPYYAATVRSMSMSWHNFFFAAFDPMATVSVDKLPGAFWIQALSVRVFGVHEWAMILPQVVEGTLTVLVIYRVARRLAGPVAGIVSVIVLVVSPVTVALNRGNISDTLMVLLLVLAADATVAAIITGHWRNILFAGIWVGLAFQAKMIEAWLVLPALGLVYLVAAPGDSRRRLLRLGATGLVTFVVSLSWMTLVTFTPAPGRPYVDGSHDDSLYAQVFLYNGFGRLDQASPNQLLTKTTGIELPMPPSAAWNRLLIGSYGHDVGWLLPASLMTMVAGLVARRRKPRNDLVRAMFVLWGTWLVVLAVVFSVSGTINAYYTAALSPAIAGLLGTGLVVAWRHRETIAARATIAGVVLVTTGYAAWLLPGAGTGLPGWLGPLVIALGLSGTVAVVTSARLVTRRKLLGAIFATATMAVLVVPAVASASVVSNRLGPFDTPFQTRAVTYDTHEFFEAPAAVSRLLPLLEEVRQGARYLMAVQSAALASPFIYDTGQEVLPIGGFTGTIPEPTLETLDSMIDVGDFHLVLQSSTTTDPRLIWIARNCVQVGGRAASSSSSFPGLAVHYCVRLR